MGNIPLRPGPGNPEFGDKKTKLVDPFARDQRGRDEIIDTAKALISGDRQATYGDARADFTRTGKMWAAVLGLDVVTPEQVALCMAMVKVGLLCETPSHKDSWVDIIGYAALGGEIGTTSGGGDEPPTQEPKYTFRQFNDAD